MNARNALVVLGVAAVAATIAAWTPWASAASPDGSGYEPVLDPADFGHRLILR